MPREFELRLRWGQNGYCLELEHYGEPREVHFHPPGLPLKHALLMILEQYEPLLAVELGADPLEVLERTLRRSRVTPT